MSEHSIQTPKITAVLQSTTPSMSVSLNGDNPRIGVSLSGEGMHIPPGGLEGQALVKKTDSDYDVEWSIIESSSFPEEGNVGDILMKTSGDGSGVGWVTPADSPEGDNTRPITAAAVYMTVGNINALLETI